MYYIAVCDDVREDIEVVIAYLQDYQREHPHFSYKIYEFHSMEALMLEIEDGARLDLLFLDICMDGTSGTEGARQLRQYGFEGQIIFQSSSQDFVFAAFAVDATQYLVKPIQKLQFFQAMDQARAEHEKNKVTYITLNVVGEIKRVNLNQFIYAETHGNYQHILMDGGEESVVRITATNLFTQVLHDRRFVQIGKAYIVNMSFIDKFTAKDITFMNGEMIYLPRGHFPKFKEEYFKFLL